MSLPSFYNYESFDNNLKKKLAKEFKLNFKNINGIKYNFFPRPHFIVENASFGFLNQDNEVAEIKKEFNGFIKHMNNNIHKPISIKNSNFFFKK